MEFAEKGEMMVWDEDKHIFTHSLNENKFLDENFLRFVIRDVIKALHYSIFPFFIIHLIVFIFKKKSILWGLCIET